MESGEESGLNNRLRVLRAERGWSQAELGGRIGVSRQAVNAIETGKHDPSLPLAFRLARLFGLTIEEIAETLAISKRTVDGDWALARLWIARALSKG